MKRNQIGDRSGIITRADKAASEPRSPFVLLSEIDLTESRTMMLHNNDEICEFDAKVYALHSLLDSANEQETVSAVGDVMRILVSHDWPEWASGHRWCVHPDCFEAFDTDDAEYLKRFVAIAITVMKSGGTQGRDILQRFAELYLRQRGYRVAASLSKRNTNDPWQGWKTSKQYAADLDLHPKSIQRALPGLIETKQAERKSERGKINLRQSACEILKPQD